MDISLSTAIKSKSYKEYRVIIRFKSLQSNMERHIAGLKGSITQSIPIINCISATLVPSIIEKIAQFPEVDYISLDTFCYICGESTLVANKVYNNERYKLTGNNIGIGIVDTGVSGILTLFSHIKRFLILKI